MKNDWLFNSVPYFIAFVFIAIICFYVGLGILAFKGFDLIQKDGLKSVIDTIWEGKK